MYDTLCTVIWAFQTAGPAGQESGAVLHNRSDLKLTLSCPKISAIMEGEILLVCW